MSVNLAQLLLAVMVFVASGSVLYIARFVARRSVFLYGHRTRARRKRNGDGPDQFGPVGSQYRFAIQNSESLPIDVPLIARIELLGDTGTIEGRPRIFAGPRRLNGSIGEGQREFALLVRRLPAYGTWVIEFGVKGNVKGAAMQLEEADTRRIRGVPRQRVQVSQATPPIAVSGQSRWRDWPLHLLLWLLAAVVYLLPMMFIIDYYRFPYAWAEMAWVDGLMLLGLLITGTAMLRFGVRSEPSAIQGYQAETYVEWA